MAFVLGSKSLSELNGVHPALVELVHQVIQETPQDFIVFDGLRTRAEQTKLMASGATRTMKSMHLPQADGYSHAIDLVPYVGGRPRWEWGPIWPIASTVHAVALRMRLKLVWGGVWDKAFSILDGSPAGLRKAVDAYCVRHPGPDFLDGPHYQLTK